MRAGLLAFFVMTARKAPFELWHSSGFASCIAGLLDSPTTTLIAAEARESQRDQPRGVLSARGSVHTRPCHSSQAVAWRYVHEAVANEVVESMHSLGGRVFGLCRR
jgi:hypothetical protein